MPTVSAGRRPNGNGETVGTKYVCVPVRGCRKLSMKAGSLYVIGHIDVGSWFTPEFPAGGPTLGWPVKDHPKSVKCYIYGVHI